MDVETYKKLSDKKNIDSNKRMANEEVNQNRIKSNTKLIKPESKSTRNSWIPKNDISTYFLVKKPENTNLLGKNSTFERITPEIKKPGFITKGVDDGFKRDSNFKGKDDGFYYKDSWPPNLSGANILKPKPENGSIPNYPNKKVGSVFEIGAKTGEKPDVGARFEGFVSDKIDDIKRAARTKLGAVENYAGSYFKLWDIQEDTMDPINKFYWKVYRGVVNNKCEENIIKLENALKDPNLPDDIRVNYELYLEMFKNEYNNDEMPFGRVAEYLYNCSDKNLEMAKEGLSPIEQFAIDVSYEGLQTAGDYAVGAAIGCGDTVVSAARAAAEATYKAEKEGKSEGEALVCGGFEFLKDYGTGKLFDLFGDNIGNKFIKQIEKVVEKSPIGKQIIKEIGKLTINGSLNAVEEFSSGMLDPIINAISYMDPSELSDYLDSQFYSDLWYNSEKAFFTPEFD